MSSRLGELHQELRSTARQFLDRRAGEGVERPWSAPGHLDPDPPFDQLAGLGWLGLEVAEDLGGAGATFAESAVVLEELGRAASGRGFVGSAVLGVGALNLTEPGPVRDQLLRAVASGARRLALSLTDPAGGLAEPAAFRLEGRGGVLTVDGRSGFVLDAPGAESLLVVATDGGREPVLVELGPEHPGLEVREQPVLDSTRGFASVTARGVAVEPERVLRLAGDPEWGLERLFERAALVVSWDSLGLCEAMLQATLAHAQNRVQFGRPIGSFQAVKHACADMAVQLALGRRLLVGAVEELCAGAGGARAVSMAKSFVTSSAVEVVGKALQLHGGIGYTWESGVHAYLKRAALNRSLFGSPMAHRKRLAARYGAGDRPGAGPDP